MIACADMDASTDGDNTGTGFRRVAAVMMFLGVALGAIAAHALEDVLVEYDRVGTWDTAVLYHLVHGLALLVIAGRGKRLAGPCWCFLIGTVLFSGSLYALALTQMKWLAMITPFGGLTFLVGWLWLAIRPK